MCIRLMQGDCLELLGTLPDNSIDMVLCDPPYGIDFQSCRAKDKTRRKAKILNDKKPFVEFIPMLKRLLKPSGCVMVFTRWDVQQAFVDAMNNNGMPLQNVLIWDKKVHGMGDLRRAFGSRYESILFHAEQEFRFQGKRPTDIIECPRVPAQKLVHPNEKPVELLKYLINTCCTPGGVILDCFMGSGSAGTAAVLAGRSFVGIELDDGYYKLAEGRIRDAEAQTHDLLEYVPEGTE